MKVRSGKEPLGLRGALRKPATSLVHARSRALRHETESDPAPPSAWELYWQFLIAGITRHTQTGGVIPSQRFLIDRMIAPVPADYRGQVVELGPGTGALTMRLAERCPAADVLACEINPNLAEILRERVHLEGLEDRVKVVSEAAEQLLETIAKGRSEARPHFIISGIPLGNLRGQSAIKLIRLIHEALVPRGLYIQFQHSLLDRRKIKARFSRMRTVPVLLNFPPAVVYYAWK